MIQYVVHLCYSYGFVWFPLCVITKLEKEFKT